MSSRPPLVACWLDKSIGEAGAYLTLKQQFEGVSNRIVQWKYFDCTDHFTEFVDENPNVKIVAIISGAFAKQVVTPLSDRDALHSVYVFCGNKGKYQNLLTEEPKIKGIFDSEETLYNRMHDDLQREFP